MKAKKERVTEWIALIMLYAAAVAGNIAASRSTGAPNILPDEVPVVWFDMTVSMICLVLFATFMLNRSFKSTATVLFNLIIWLTGIFSALDLFIYVYDRIPEAGMMNLVHNTAVFLGDGALAVIYTLYLQAEIGRENVPRAKLINVTAAVLYGAHCVFVLLNMHFGYAFRIIDGAYTGEALEPLCYIQPVIALLTGLVIAAGARGVPRRDKLAMMAFPVAPLVSIFTAASGSYGMSLYLMILFSLLIMYGFIYTKRGNALSLDALTGVGSLSEFYNRLRQVDSRLHAGNKLRFGIAVCDIDGLKRMNDAYGHSAGDLFIIRCSRDICSRFKHSPVYRIGGDEFAVYLEGEDFDSAAGIIEEALLAKAADAETSTDENRTAYSVGYAAYEPDKDSCARDVLKRADADMYGVKNEDRWN